MGTLAEARFNIHINVPSSKEKVDVSDYEQKEFF